VTKIPRSFSGKPGESAVYEGGIKRGLKLTPGAFGMRKQGKYIGNS
jgi:hypothetical protein